MGRDSKERRTRGGLAAACVGVALAVLAPTPARADFWCWLLGSGCGGGGGSEQVASPQGGAPEIDPRALTSALGLAAGGAALLGDGMRRRRRR